MPLNRRTFLRHSIAGAAATALAMKPRYVWAFGQSPAGITKFTTPIRGLGAAPQISVASPTTSIPGQYDQYSIDLVETEFQFHPNLPASKIWCYTQSGTTPTYLGGNLVVTRGQPVRVRFTNKLPSTHPLPVDDTLLSPPPVGTLVSERNVPGAQQHNRAAVHQHGGLLDWTSDGGPFDWFTPNGHYGPSLTADSPLRHDVSGNAVAPNQIELFQSNEQSARFGWYHDHAAGITRLNAYAGLASGYFVTDAIEQDLISKGYLPNTPGYPLGIPLVLQDKTFFNGQDPNYSWGLAGDLFYPYLYEANLRGDGSANPKGRWDFGPTVQPPAAPPPGGWRSIPGPSIVPEFFADTLVVNGVCYPYLPVEQRWYRFRVLNGCQARFFNLNLYVESRTRPGEVDTQVVRNADGSTSVVPVGKAGPAIVMIGTEGGFLDQPTLLNAPPVPCKLNLDPVSGNYLGGQYNLLLAPGERADILIDFSSVAAGTHLILYNDAPAPFPGGDVRNDYYAGAPDLSAIGGAPTAQPGQGPDTRTLLQFRVGARTGAADAPSLGTLGRLARQANASALSEAAALFATPGYVPAAQAIRTRHLTLNEDFDQYGRLVQRLGTDVMTSPTAGTFARDYDSTPTEIVKAGSTEIWRIFNTTGDTHPMHFHLVNARILSRRPFSYTVDAAGKMVPTLGPARPADANERGPKETIRMNPGEMIELLMTFNLPKNVPYTVPFSARLKQQYNIDGYEYVWHCHILEHEEHDMMRPLVVVP